MTTPSPDTSLREALERVAEGWQERSDALEGPAYSYPEAEADRDARHDVYGFCADEVRQLLAQHPESTPAAVVDRESLAKALYDIQRAHYPSLPAFDKALPAFGGSAYTDNFAVGLRNGAERAADTLIESRTFRDEAEVRRETLLEAADTLDTVSEVGPEGTLQLHPYRARFSAVLRDLAGGSDE